MKRNKYVIVNFIRVVSIPDRKAVSVLQRAAGLDIGESEAIIYADDMHADIFLIDEASGRRAAMDMGLNDMGSIGVLISAFKHGYINSGDADEAFMKNRKC